MLNASVWISYDKFNIGEMETEHRIGDERGKFTQHSKFLKKRNINLKRSYGCHV